ncbi:spermatogenesis-associated protein 1 isoform 2-T2 [Anomaloglossus baeobatrachus]|uniref:spermatogenesis-associated protein 1 n=1 Tax=Anomaloglossus baeobatrachus TaxID=238106 RepID=UPI003F50AE0B
MDSNPGQTPMNQTRPSTAGLIELHVYLVPEELWSPELNKASLDVIERFISLGFIRVLPDMTLWTLRENLAEFLGDGAVTDKFVFLKSVGSSLAAVKLRQEYNLKLKAFAPPYAREPELYLLPRDVYEGSVYGSTLSPDHYQAEYPSSEQSEAQADGVIHDRTRIQPITENNPAAPRAAQDGGRSFIWNKKRRDVVPVTSQIQYRAQPESGAISPLLHENISKKSEVVGSKDGKKLPGRNPTGDSGIADSLLDAKPEPKRKEIFVPENPAMLESSDGGQQFGERHPSQRGHYRPPPSPPLLPDFPMILSPKPRLPSHGETILEQLSIVEEERITLEKSREEIIKRMKYLLEQHKLRRQQARDSWKKKYYETKKETATLEEKLNRLIKETNAQYQRLLTQLAARESKKRAKHPTLAANSKDSLIMTITKKRQELEQLKRKVENARIKLVIEIKMRKQASSDLNVLKAELAQKKAQFGLWSPPPLFAL